MRRRTLTACSQGKRKGKGSKTGSGDLSVSDEFSGPDSGDHESGAIEKTLNKLTGLTLKHSKIILFVALLACCAGLYADQTIPIKTDINSFIPQDMPSLIYFKHMQSVLPGQGSHLNVILKVDDNSDPEILEWIDEFSRREVANRGHINSASSIVDLIKERNGGIIPETSDEVQAIYEEIPESQKGKYIEGNQLLHIDLDIGNAMEDL